MTGERSRIPKRVMMNETVTYDGGTFAYFDPGKNELACIKKKKGRSRTSGCPEKNRCLKIEAASGY